MKTNIMQQLGGVAPRENIGLSDAAIIEAIRKVHPNLGNCQITKENYSLWSF
ncbi:MAG: hypothetical protein NC245_00980 [Muribaculum sp.]|nr:hypothetical protein [Ruminococcus flavefaciens]MCM1373647.1 hypothetical protein [Muribaculum sp.]